MQTGGSTVSQNPSHPPALSFIVPVRNDATRLRKCLASIRVAASPFAMEIVVGDNGSTDESATVASDFGAIVLSAPNVPVAEVRNAAARSACGDLLAFVDADHEIDPGWAAAAVESLADGLVWAAGDQYHAPTGGTWVQRAYDLLRRHRPGIRDVDWLPSGNLVVRRTAFIRLGGFDASLETCEDVDFCQRLRAAGGRLVATDRLRSVHHGDPPSLKALFLGELWRGRDNLRVSLRAPLTSRSVPSLAFPVVNLVALAVIVAGCALWPVWGWPLPIAGAVVLVLGLSARALMLLGRAGIAQGIAGGVELATVSAVYDVARALALVSRVGHDRRRRS